MANLKLPELIYKKKNENTKEINNNNEMTIFILIKILLDL